MGVGLSCGVLTIVPVQSIRRGVQPPDPYPPAPTLPSCPQVSWSTVGIFPEKRGCAGKNKTARGDKIHHKSDYVRCVVNQTFSF